jgi:hypothetical protein
MRKLVCLVIGILFSAGCATATESEFWKHDTMYKNSGHLKYSWCGYKDCKPESAKATKEQGWWGKNYCVK